MSAFDAILDATDLADPTDVIAALEPGDGVTLVYDSPRSDEPQTASGQIIGTDDDAVYARDANDYRRSLILDRDGTLSRETASKSDQFEPADHGHRPSGYGRTRLGDVIVCQPNDDVSVGRETTYAEYRATTFRLPPSFRYCEKRGMVATLIDRLEAEGGAAYERSYEFPDRKMPYTPDPPAWAPDDDDEFVTRGGKRAVVNSRFTFAMGWLHHDENGGDDR